MLHIVVTGGIACGKSSVGDILSARGATVRDTDDMSHHLLKHDNAVSRSVIDEFGKGILDSEGAIDRTKLGRLVFSDDAARQRLNRIVHPKIAAMCNHWLAQKEQECGMAVLIVPLLFEAGMASGWHAIICVACSRVTQMRRLNDRGLPGEQAKQRIDAQMSLSYKMATSDYVIFNNGQRSTLERQTDMVINSILERKTW